MFLLSTVLTACGLIEVIDEETSVKYGGEITVTNNLNPFGNGYDAVIEINHEIRGVVKYNETKTFSVKTDGVHLIKAHEPDNITHYSFGIEWKISLYNGEKKSIIINNP